MTTTTISSKFKNLFRPGKEGFGRNGIEQVRYAPPPGPPPPLPLKVVELPNVIPEHRFNLADQGWTTITFDTQEDPLLLSYQQLFDASKTFFDLPIEYKEQFKSKHGSEEGWSRNEGEKEFITLRKQRDQARTLKLVEDLTTNAVEKRTKAVQVAQEKADEELQRVQLAELSFRTADGERRRFERASVPTAAQQAILDTLGWPIPEAYLPPNLDTDPARL